MVFNGFCSIFQLKFQQLRFAARIRAPEDLLGLNRFTVSTTGATESVVGKREGKGKVVPVLHLSTTP
jgi:hypothetical protein